MRTSCSPCSCLTTSSKSLDQLRCWHQEEECVFVCVWVCKRNKDWKDTVCECVCMCGRILTYNKLVLVYVESLTAPRGPLPLPGSSVAFLQWSFPDFLPYRAEPYFYPETQTKKESSGLTGTGTPETPHLFYLNFIYYLHSEEGSCSKNWMLAHLFPCLYDGWDLDLWIWSLLRACG